MCVLTLPKDQRRAKINISRNMQRDTIMNVNKSLGLSTRNAPKKRPHPGTNEASRLPLGRIDRSKASQTSAPTGVKKPRVQAHAMVDARQPQVANSATQRCDVGQVREYADEIASAKILDDLKKGDPEAVSVQAFKRFVVMSYENKDHQFLIRRIMWSWSHIKKFNNDQLSSITKAFTTASTSTEPSKGIPLTDGADSLLFGDRSYKGGHTIFACCNGRSIGLYSQEMLDAALNMEGLTGRDLGYLLDNYVLGSVTMSDQPAFNSLANRDKIFKSTSLDREVINFIDEKRGAAEFAEKMGLNEHNPVAMIDESEFISQDVAQKAFGRLIAGNNVDDSSYCDLVKMLLRCGELACHLNDEQLGRLVGVAYEKGIDVTLPEVELHSSVVEYLKVYPIGSCAESSDSL